MVVASVLVDVRASINSQATRPTDPIFESVTSVPRQTCSDEDTHAPNTERFTVDRDEKLEGLRRGGHARFAGATVSRSQYRRRVFS